jgi:hypothetical protein
MKDAPPYVVFVLAFEGWLILVGTLLKCDLHRVPLFSHSRNATPQPWRNLENNALSSLHELLRNCLVGGGEGQQPLPLHYWLNMEVDIHSLFGLHVTGCAHLYSLAENRQPPPPHWDSYTRALLVSKDRRHLFVTFCPSHTLTSLFRNN